MQAFIGSNGYWITASGHIHALSIAAMRATRISRSGVNQKRYLAQWAGYQFNKGRDILTHEEAISPFLRARTHAHATSSSEEDSTAAARSEPSA